MNGFIKNYAKWLHGQWPCGTIEKLPLINDDGTCNVPGVYIIGDLTGIPLLKFAADSGAAADEHLSADEKFIKRKQDASVYDLIIIGGGVSSYSAALGAKKKNLHFILLEASEDFSTITNFPNKDKCISCNQCASVCHQGIDIMGFANKGIPMEDPQCVRCSACVQICPTGVLQFGEINKATGKPLRLDKINATMVN